MNNFNKTPVMIKMIVFDMAGTTVDEDNVVYKTLQWAINKKGFNFTLDQVLAEGAGKEKLQAIKTVLQVYANNEDANLAREIYADFAVALEKAYQSMDIRQQPNAEKLFAALHAKNILVTLNTGYSKETAQSLVDKLGWKKGAAINYLVTASDVKNNRPQPDMILFAMEQSGINDPGEIIKVGDSVIDIEEGKNAGCIASIGITTGAHTRSQLELANPDYIINDLIELLPIIDKLNK